MIHKTLVKLLSTPVVIFLTLSVLIFNACHRATSATGTRAMLDDIHIMSSADPELGIDTYDSTILMERGAAAYNSGDFALAIKFFRRFIRDYPSSPKMPSALFNLGLSCESAGDLNCASTSYSRLLDLYPTTPEIFDSRFRYGSVLLGLSKYKEARNIYETILKIHGLSDSDKFEAQIGLGISDFGLCKLDDAEMTLIKAMGVFRSVTRRELIENNSQMAEAQFYLGEINRVRMENVLLVFPELELEKRLQTKAAYLLEAQNQYIRVIRIGNLQWATAAGLRIGMLYETFHEQLLSAPVPPELDAEQATVYRDELRHKISVLLAKAINVYERTVEMALRVGINSRWVEEAGSRLEKLKKIYIKENLQ